MGQPAIAGGPRARALHVEQQRHAVDLNEAREAEIVQAQMATPQGREFAARVLALIWPDPLRSPFNPNAAIMAHETGQMDAANRIRALLERHAKAFARLMADESTTTAPQ